MRVQTAIAYANASCVDGKPQLTGTSQVAGLTVLGQELPVNQAVEQALSLDTGAVDPSNIDLSKVVVIQATPGVTLSLAPVAAALQTALDALPTIALPPNVGQVKITPGAQVRTADTLTQQALRVQVSLLGQNVADLLVGEAKVGSAGVDCAAPSASPRERARPAVHQAPARPRRRPAPRQARADRRRRRPQARRQTRRRSASPPPAAASRRPSSPGAASFRTTAPLPPAGCATPTAPATRRCSAGRSRCA